MEKRNQITLEAFEKVDMRVGTIVGAAVNKKSRNPAYKLKIDLGEELGVKTSSAQITQLYTPEELLGRQVVVVANFPPVHIGDVTSQVRVLGSDSAQGVVLLSPTHPAKNGDRIF